LTDQPRRPAAPHHRASPFRQNRSKIKAARAKPRYLRAKMPHATRSAFLAVELRVWFERAERDAGRRRAVAPHCTTPTFRSVEMKSVKTTTIAGLAAVSALLAPSFAIAGQPVPWQMGFQPAATGTMEEIRWFEQYTLWFIVPITLLVTALLAWVMIKYRSSANPVPSRTSHNTAIEVIWTVAPVIVLLLLAVPSFQLLTAQYNPPEDPTMTIKATGVQWYWEYEYQDEEPLTFASLLLADDDRAGLGKEDMGEYPRLLAVDNDVVVPVDTTVRVLVTASDVLHAFAMPAFGIKVDAVPGRLNEIWFRAEREGIFYGQCSELCGKDHAYMPIGIRVVSQEQYDTWRGEAQANLSEANERLMAALRGEGTEVADAGN
jgi:cytochrome c oxidase subunit 2